MTGSFDFTALHRLLPFYVNGTLDPAQRADVETALTGSEELRAALREEQLLQARHRQATEAVLTAAEPGLADRQDALLARLDDQGEVPAPLISAGSAAKPQSGGLLAALALLNPRRWHPAVALSLLVAVPAQAAVIASQTGKIALLQDENFQLASGPCDDRPPAGAIQLELNDAAQWSAVASLLDTEELTIARSGGLGVLTVKSGKQGAPLQALIARLRASPVVASAEPAA